MKHSAQVSTCNIELFSSFLSEHERKKRREGVNRSNKLRNASVQGLLYLKPKGENGEYNKIL